MSPATRLRLFYFAFYGGVGIFLPYFAPYLRGLGFWGEQIGTVQMIGPLVAVPAAIAWSVAADRLRAPARVLRFATAWAFLAVLFLPAARTPFAVGAVLLATALADRAVVPLVDSVTVEWAAHHPGTTYARIRLFGSVGFAVLTSVVGSPSPGAATGRATRSFPSPSWPAWVPMRSWPGASRPRLPRPTLPASGRWPRCSRTGRCSGCSSSSPSTGAPRPHSTSSSASSYATWGFHPASPA